MRERRVSEGEAGECERRVSVRERRVSVRGGEGWERGGGAGGRGAQARGGAPGTPRPRVERSAAAGSAREAWAESRPCGGRAEEPRAPEPLARGRDSSARATPWKDSGSV